jgi:argininosuccinate lyase
MPQKRNPVALEHSRILASRALGEAQAVLTCAHNTPFGDINDSEDDLQPLVFTMFTDASRSLRLLAGLLRTAEVDRDRLASRAGADFMTVTELADTLVRNAGLSFREAHTLVSNAVKAAGANDSPRAIATALLAQDSSLRLSQDEIERSLDPMNFVRVRSIIGGPAPEVVTEALARARHEQAEIQRWLQEKQQRLDAARQRNLET